jgi:hypothetical protein
MSYMLNGKLYRCLKRLDPLLRVIVRRFNFCLQFLNHLNGSQM